MPQFEMHALGLDFAAEGEAEFGLCLEPDRIQRKAMLVKIAQHGQEVFP